MDDGPVLLLRVLVSLLCVVGLIWVVARKVGATPGRRVPAGPSLQVVGRQSLGRHAGVAVLAVGNRRLLLGYGEQQVTMLTELAPVLDAEPVHGREVETRPAGRSLPASLTAFVAAHRPGRSAAVPVPAADTDTDAPVPAADTDTDTDAPAGADTEGTTVPAPESASAETALIPTQASGPSTGRSALDGSILSATTWRRAVTTLQERTVRR
jgi:flagellar protein FliO/FliZ